MTLLAPFPILVCITIGTSICIFGTVMFYSVPSIIHGIITKNMVLDTDSEFAQFWKETPIPIYMQFYIFNYTNHEDFLDSLKGNLVKPIVQQLGPYTYRQLRKKEQIQWNDDDDIVEYRERKTYIFIPEMSSGSEDDLITFPNIPLTTIAQMAPPVEKPALGAAIQMTNATLFISQTVGRLLFKGYKDNLVELIQMLTGEQLLPGSMFGLFYQKNDTDDGLYQVHRGKKNPDLLGSVSSWNNSSKLSYWSGDKCNALRGTDGSFFRTHVPKSENIYIFSPDLCRSLFLAFKREIEFKTVKGFRFEVNLDMLGDYNMNPDNDCFCYPNMSYCTGAGVLNLASCKEGAPIFMSSPHFLMAEFQYLRAVEGLEPAQDEHVSFVEIEPLSGSLLRAARKIQMNVRFQPVSNFSIIEDLPQILLPLLWLNESAELTSDLIDKIQRDLFFPMTIGFITPIVLVAVGGLTLILGVVSSLLLNYKFKLL